jgi:hypothetical protein
MISNSLFFDQHVPTRLQRAILKAVFENYKEASRFCYRHFASTQAKDLSGVFRRAKIEEEFAGIEALFPGIVQVTPQAYEHNTGYYNELTCGPVKLTQSCISDPDDVPRFAKFRSTLACSGQLSLFEPTPESSTVARYMYSILTHAVDAASPKRSWPAFVRVQFPNEPCTAYLDDGIDLMARFPQIVSEYIPKQTFGRQATPRRRRKEEGA